MGAPIKISPFIEVAIEVLDDKWSIFLTDSELVDQINEQLLTKDQISQRTFERWKAAAIDDQKYTPIERETLDKLCRLIKKAQRKQKVAIFKKMLNKKNGAAWTKYAWCLERKFPEWNLKSISENKNEHTGNVSIDMSKWK